MAAVKRKKRVENKEIKQSISVAGCCAFFFFFQNVTESIRVKCNGVSEDDKTVGEWSNIEKWFPGERCSPAV